MQSPDKTAAFRRNLPRVAAALPLLLAASLPAQSETADQPAAASANEEIVILSPFTVSDKQTHGYQATNSIGGTRSNTPIKDVPLNIQVFTKDMAQDIIATSQIDLERYNAALVNGGADVHSTNAIQQAYNGFLFRGFVQNWGLRDGVRQYDPIDMQGLARVEVVKGPAAPLYGLSYPGGIMNSVTKSVDFTDNFTTIGASIQSEGEYRATIDANYTGDIANGGKFGIRYNAAFSQTEDFRAHSQGKVEYNQVNLAWKPLPRTEVNFLFEDGYREKPNSLGYFTRTDTYAVNRYAPTAAEGTEIPLQVAHPNIPWSWNWADKFNMRSVDTKMYKGSITQSIGDNFSVTAYLQYSKRKNIDSDGWDAAGNGGSAASWDLPGRDSADINFENFKSRSPNGTNMTGWIVDPTTWTVTDGGVDTEGRPVWTVTPNTGTEIIRKQFHYRDWNNKNRAYGITAVYKLETGPLKHTFTAGANAWSEDFISYRSAQPYNSPNVVDFAISDSVNPSAVGTVSPSDYVNSIGSPAEDNSNDYYFASWQMYALDDRLKVNAAINRTNLKLVQHSATPNITKQSKNSPMIGAMYDITKSVSVFAVHSTSLFPTSDKNDFDVQMPPVTGSSVEGGLKVELMGGKISGTLSYYEITMKGGSQRDNSAPNRRNGAWDSMTEAEKAAATAAGDSRDKYVDRLGQPGDLVPGGKQKSKGFEADLVFQPTPSWQILLSYAHNNQKVTEAINAATIGQSTNGHVKDQCSLLTKYSFSDGSVKGLSLGMGAQYRGKALQGYIGNGLARYNPSDIYLEVFAGYKFTAWGYDHRVQLNVKNLTKVDDYVGWYANTGETYATHRYKAPTKIIWNLGYTLEF